MLVGQIAVRKGGWSHLDFFFFAPQSRKERKKDYENHGKKPRWVK
jgi:hypothetical protein